MTESLAKLSCEMRVVAKTAGVGDLAQGLPCSERRPTMQQARGMLQAQRVNEFAAGRAARRKELLQIAQRNARGGRYFRRTEIRIGEAVFGDVADPRKQLVRMA